MQDLVRQLLAYLRGMWKYRWYGLSIAWVICIGGWIAVALLPDKYEASARVYVDTQSVLKPLLHGLAVQPNVDQQVAMMSRTLISRPNLERVIRMSDLDIKLKTSADREALIDGLAKQIKLMSTGRDNLYSIAYQAADPEQAKRVVQSLLTIFVEGSLGDKRKDADSAKRFLDEQIRLYEQKLIAAENSLKEFKQRNLGMMPSQGRDFSTRVGEANALLRQARLELREAENARDAFKAQLQQQSAGVYEPNLLAQGSASEPQVTFAASPELEARITALKQKLDQMRLSFTERHPDVIAAKRVLGQLEEQKKEEIAKVRKDYEARRAKERPAGGGVTPVRANPVVQQLTVALTEAEAAVAALRTRVAQYEKNVEDLAAAAHAVPRIEAELVQLNRDYEVNQRNYEQLLARRESAQLSGEMESSAGVLDFRIIDPPRVPPTPSAPKRVPLMGLVLLLGLGAGVAVTFLLSQIRPVFDDRAALQEFASVPILGSVSMKLSDRDVRRQRRGVLGFVATVASLLGSFGAALALLTVLGRA